MPTFGMREYFTRTNQSLALAYGLGDMFVFHVSQSSYESTYDIKILHVRLQLTLHRFSLDWRQR